MARPEIIELVRKAKKGDRLAFEELCLAKMREITFAALMKVGNQQDAEDVAQETVITMYRFIGKLKSPDSIDVWINSIIRSRCMDLFRKRGSQDQELDIDDELINIPEDDDRDFLPDAYAEDASLRSKLMEAVNALSDRAREVITLYYYEGLSYKEIAEVMCIDKATVSSNLIYARNKLKKKIMTENKNIASASKFAGIAATSTVMGRELNAEAVAHVK